MSTASIPPNKILMFAVVGIGLFWMSTRKANAATLSNPNAQSARNPAARSFFQSPAVASTRQGVATQAPAGNGSFISSTLNALLNPALVRSPGFNPGYYPDTAGEADAALYYQANRDLFASNPPSSYQVNTDTYGGIDSR